MSAPAYTIWYADSRAQAELILRGTKLAHIGAQLCRLPGQRKQFPAVPRSLQQILYLDRPDLIVTHGDTHEPVVAIELSAEAPSGHDAFQRFARVSACASEGVPFAYMFPARKLVRRRGGPARWDEYNPLIFEALLRVARKVS